MPEPAADPPIRILHVLARSGGTLVGKCLGVMAEVMLLSEIHPYVAGPMGPVRQGERWFGLVTAEEAERLEDPERFAEAIALLRHRAEAQGRKLILRDWSHIDFYGRPYNEAPSGRSILADTLAGTMTLRRAAVTRHPLDQLLSLGRLIIMNGHLDLEPFLQGYRRFAEMAAAVGFVRYEDLTTAPDATLGRLCGLLDVVFDPTYAGRWAGWEKITGDTGHSGRGNAEAVIRPIPRYPVPPDVLAYMAAHADYRTALALLGYEHPAQA